MTTLFDWQRDEEDVAAEIQSRVESAITLRPYQQEAVDGVYEAWGESQSTLVCLPTGTGKSVVFSEVMRRWVEGAA